MNIIEKLAEYLDARDKVKEEEKKGTESWFWNDKYGLQSEAHLKLDKAAAELDTALKDLALRYARRRRKSRG